MQSYGYPGSMLLFKKWPFPKDIPFVKGDLPEDLDKRVPFLRQVTGPLGPNCSTWNKSLSDARYKGST